MSTPTRYQREFAGTDEPRQRKPRRSGGFTDAHRAVNRALATLALLLSILALVVFLVGAYRLDAALDAISQSLAGFGDMFAPTPAFEDPTITDGIPGNETD